MKRAATFHPHKPHAGHNKTISPHTLGECSDENLMDVKILDTWTHGSQFFWIRPSQVPSLFEWNLTDSNEITYKSWTCNSVQPQLYLLSIINAGILTFGRVWFCAYVPNGVRSRLQPLDSIKCPRFWFLIETKPIKNVHTNQTAAEQLIWIVHFVVASTLSPLIQLLTCILSCPLVRGARPAIMMNEKKRRKYYKFYNWFHRFVVLFTRWRFVGVCVCSCSRGNHSNTCSVGTNGIFFLSN